MSWFVCLLLSVLSRRATARDLQYTPNNNQLFSDENTTGGSLIDEMLVTSRSDVTAPSLEDRIRRQLMRDNYDYVSKNSAETTVQMNEEASTTKTTASPTTTVSMITNIASTSVTADTSTASEHSYAQGRVMLLRANNVSETLDQTPTTELLYVPSLPGLNIAHKNIVSPIDDFHPEESPSPSVGGKDAYISEENEPVFNNDLLYYMDDDRLKDATNYTGLNFRRYNIKPDHDIKRLTETREQYDYNPYEYEDVPPPPSAVEPVNRDMHRGHRHHRHRHRRRRPHMTRDALYRSRRYNKKPGRQLQHSGNRESRQGHQLRMKQIYKRDNRKINGKHLGLKAGPRQKALTDHMRYIRDRKRNAKFNLIRRGFDAETDKNEATEENNGRRFIDDGQNDNIGLGYHDVLIDSRDYKQQDEHDNSSDGYNATIPDNKVPESRNEELQPDNKFIKGDSLSDDVSNKNDFRRSNKEQAGQQNGPPDVKEDTDQKNDTDVQQKHSTFKYKLLKVRSARSFRRNGAPDEGILQERSAAGVALIPLGARRIPQFRLPRSRRQYMHERSVVYPPLNDLLPHASD